MAAGTSFIDVYFTNGKKLSVLITTSAAVGTVATVSWDGAAATTSHTDFQVDRTTCIRDIICTVGTAGGVTAGETEIYNVSKSARTGRMLPNNTTNWAATVANRAIPRICLAAGQTYRLIQSTAQVSA